MTGQESTREEATRFFVLGPLQAERDGGVLPLGGLKLRILVAALLLSPNRTVSVDRLMELLWGEEPGERAQATLHVYVAKLRKALGSESQRGTSLIETVKPGYRISVDEDTLDLLAFEALVGRARKAMAEGEANRASGLFREALALPRGRLLADLVDEPFFDLESETFERSLLGATTDFYECELLGGRHHDVINDLERLVANNPLDERLCALLMLGLYRAGRQVDALNAYKQLRTYLGEELGIDPGPEIENLELQVLNHDPALRASGFRPSLEEAPPTVTRSTRTATRARLLLDGEEILLSRVVTTIGRLRDQTVVVPDPDASRKHAEIRRTAQGYMLVDVGSTNGTMVNDRKVSDHRLRSGDQISIGDTVLLFEED